MGSRLISAGISLVVLCQLLVAFSAAVAGETGDSDPTVGGLWYLAYQQEDISDTSSNRFSINRSYLTVQKKITGEMSGRITLDNHLADNGDYAVRLKYAYGDFKFADFLFFAKPEIEFGLAHRPWLDFEEHINNYRVQGTMFLERNDLFNSADLGVLYKTLLGGEMDDQYKKTVNKKYPGRYGSVALGVFNGGGYHAKEANENKTVEGRLTIRPLPDVVPGLQASYDFKFGKGNLAGDNPPDFTLNHLFVSYETAILTVTGSYYSGEGNQSGSRVDAENKAMSQDGYSAFVEFKAIPQKLSIIGRYDHFDPNTDAKDNEIDRTIAGLAYIIAGHNMILLDWDQVSYAEPDRASDSFLKLSLQVEF